MARTSLAHFGGRPGGLTDLRGLRSDRPPRRRGHHTFTEPVKQRQPEPRLEIEQLAGQTRLREMEHAAGPGERAVLGDGGNETEMSGRWSCVDW